MFCRRQDLSPLTLPLLWIAAICALGASTTGWLHAGYEYGDDASNTLFLHRWIGIGSAVALTALALWSCKVTASLRANRASAHASLSAFRYAAIVVAAAVGFVGHLGGELTITLLRDIGVGEEVHHMDDAQISLAIDWLRQREGVP